MHDAVGVQELQSARDIQRNAAALLVPPELGVAAAPYCVRQVPALPQDINEISGAMAMATVGMFRKSLPIPRWPE